MAANNSCSQQFKEHSRPAEFLGSHCKGTGSQTSVLLFLSHRGNGSQEPQQGEKDKKKCNLFLK